MSRAAYDRARDSQVSIQREMENEMIREVRL